MSAAPHIVRNSRADYYGPGVLGIFPYVDVTVEAVRRLREAGWTALRTHAPVPSHEVLDAVEPRAMSPVRAYSLLGGMAGTIAGFSLASFAGWKMHSYLGLLVGGKPPIAVPAYMIIGFELTVLVGALATMVGFLIHSRLPNLRAMFGAFRKQPLPPEGAGYDAQFTADRFGVFVPCDASRWDDVKKLLRAAGAEDVREEHGGAEE